MRSFVNETNLHWELNYWQQYVYFGLSAQYSLYIHTLYIL